MKTPKPKAKIGRPVKLGKIRRTVHVSLSAEQDETLLAEWHRRGVETRADVFRAFLDEAMGKP